ncbi:MULTISPECIES: SGNH/GDSL hydrolase family protein [Lactobacillus]|uniref:SGNH/GDSL hydrolase family protein n=1 Tax=Lactobacillus xujianguonis TaxID=2495899 RepID=A0A437SXI3_9LACO|nr:MULTISPECIES: SGNH/GDSL hydrolase family protein [Lactobacillus]RVU71618.1 SGNH/GDSL hydrolase family protein [Lactobacillus xujianguonis]RVU77731.1 SGNH/GDSL hydrolase family protein [Lactobacillus xujianguonis]
MSNETFLISLGQNNDLSKVALAELRMEADRKPLMQKYFQELADLPGNSRKYSVNSTETVISPLLNKKILFLGSSVTFGFGALGESFVDYLWKRDGIEAIKDAENGTTLVDEAAFEPGDSYVARFNKELPEAKPELFVLQLSTNDTKRGSQQLGELSQDGKFDTKTITGALEYIVSKAQATWHCPIVIYTNPYFENDLYSKMVDRAQEIVQKYGLELIDLYHNPDFKDQDSLYMADEIHPTRAGYREKWLPVFEEKLTKILQ